MCRLTRLTGHALKPLDHSQPIRWTSSPSTGKCEKTVRTLKRSAEKLHAIDLQLRAGKNENRRTTFFEQRQILEKMLAFRDKRWALKTTMLQHPESSHVRCSPGLVKKGWDYWMTVKHRLGHQCLYQRLTKFSRIGSAVCWWAEPEWEQTKFLSWQVRWSFSASQGSTLANRIKLSLPFFGSKLARVKMQFGVSTWK